MDSNPARMRKVVTLYRVALRIARGERAATNRLSPHGDGAVDAASWLWRRKLLKWMVLLEQWPCRIAWLTHGTPPCPWKAFSCVRLC